MGVITRTVWDVGSGDSVVLTTVPNPDAYGLCVTGTTAELAGIDWSDFYNGTLVINVTTGAEYYVYDGALYSRGLSGPWTALPLTAPFGNLGSIWRGLSYKKSGDQVWVQGVINSGGVAVAQNAVIAALPPAIVPPTGTSMLWGVEMATSTALGNPVMARVDVRTNTAALTLGLVPAAAANTIINHMGIDLRWSLAV